MEADVIVIGAGLAGLTAGRDLRETGRRVIVLEARDRLGGRAWTGALAGTDETVEWGGAWVHPGSPSAIDDAIGRYGLRMVETPPPTRFVWAVDGRRHAGVTARRRLMVAVDEFARPLGELRERLGATPDLGSLDDVDVSVPAWLDGLGLSAAAESVLLTFACAVGGSEPARVGVLPLILDAIQDGWRLDAPWDDVGRTFADGTIALVRALAADLDIRLGHRVRHVRHDGAGVEVTTDGGATFTGATAIIALPLNVWHDVVFDPPLSDGKARAAATGHAGHATKILAIARGIPGGFAAIGWGVPFQAMSTMRPAGHDAQVIVGFTATEPLDGTDREAVERAVRAFAPTAEIVAHGGHDWSADPFSQGTWCTIPPGWLTDGTFASLERPEGRLAFASGDVAQDGPGLLGGAMSSGVRAAATASERLA